MIAIIGLGNVGLAYEKTYHNMGFMAIDNFAKKNGFKFNKSKYAGSVAEGVFDGVKVVLLKPSTFMNLSGQSVLFMMILICLLAQLELEKAEVLAHTMVCET